MPEPVFEPDKQKSLWEHMRKESVVRLVSADCYKTRAAALRSLEDEVRSGRYAPRPITGFLTAPKSAGVPRFIPVLAAEDVCVYFACVWALDEQLAARAVPGTFGAWSLGGRRRDSEEAQAKHIYADLDPAVSVPVSQYNRAAWVQAWQEYWKLAAATHESADPRSVFVSFDVANFYDNIDLPRLEREVREVCPDSRLATEVLFYFLSTWNKGLLRYARASKGVPMDLVGDCSRLLANFYLTPADRTIRAACDKKAAKFLRFADDMTIVAPDQSTARSLLYIASEALHEIGLSINVGKVAYRKHEEFGVASGFDILDRLQAEETAPQALKALQGLYENPYYSRRTTALRRAVTQTARFKSLKEYRPWVYETAIGNAEFLLALDHRQLTHLFELSPAMDETITQITIAFLREHFTQPVVCLLRALEKRRKHSAEKIRHAANEGMKAIAALRDPVIDLAISNLPPA